MQVASKCHAFACHYSQLEVRLHALARTYLHALACNVCNYATCMQVQASGYKLTSGWLQACMQVGSDSRS